MIPLLELVLPIACIVWDWGGECYFLPSLLSSSKQIEGYFSFGGYSSFLTSWLNFCNRVFDSYLPWYVVTLGMMLEMLLVRLFYIIWEILFYLELSFTAAAWFNDLSGDVMVLALTCLCSTTIGLSLIFSDGFRMMAYIFLVSYRNSWIFAYISSKYLFFIFSSSFLWISIFFSINSCSFTSILHV